MTQPRRWLQRYMDGEHQAVWAEISDWDRAPGSPARHVDDISAVVQETMRRVRGNVELIVERLQRSGYQFFDPADGQRRRCPHIPPTPDSPAFTQWLNELSGPLPMTVTAWILTVGDVNLVGNHLDWPEQDELTDALVVELEMVGYRGRGGWDARSHFKEELAAWHDDVASCGADEVGPFALPFAPDRYHKVNVSGGSPYAFYLPDARVDATCRLDGREVSFIEYLRECFRCGGFPGAASQPQIPMLCEGLLPF